MGTTLHKRFLHKLRVEEHLMKPEFDKQQKIPHTMSTQHPDNANVPAWSNNEIIGGNAEILEAYFAYETLGCQEVMWDAEGKDVDTRVVRKLLEKYQDYFRGHVIGKDIFLTYRIPNPRIEVVEKKVAVETLQNIPVAYDVASLFYKKETTPIFEVILPFTTDSRELIWLFNYYRKTIAAAEEVMLVEPPNEKDRVVPFQLQKLEKTKNVSFPPIIGVGSKPFRGHLSPENVENFLSEYQGVTTVTVQSAFRYDYPVEQVRECVMLLNDRLPNGEPVSVEPAEEGILLGILQKCRKQYEDMVELLAP